MLITKENPSEEIQHCVVCGTNTPSIYQARNIPLCPECAIHASEDSLMEAASKSGYKFVSEILKTCLKCGYKRTPDDFGPEIECPKCEAIYAKVAAAVKMAAKPKPDIDTKKNPQLAGGQERQTRNQEVTKCKKCKRTVSKTAKVCPHCGEKDPGIGVADQIAG
ncbi:hypothetical protein KA005_39050, partial [bacterium]|nr:hypothetical protein [bacterium]